MANNWNAFETSQYMSFQAVDITLASGVPSVAGPWSPRDHTTASSPRVGILAISFSTVSSIMPDDWDWVSWILGVEFVPNTGWSGTASIVSLPTAFAAGAATYFSAASNDWSAVSGIVMRVVVLEMSAIRLLSPSWSSSLLSVVVPSLLSYRAVIIVGNLVTEKL